MAQNRRGGGGFRPPELRGTLGTLLRTTLQQAGVVRDAIASGARTGRTKLDHMRADRRRHDALAELGEIVLDLIHRGEIDLGELPEAGDLIRELDELAADGPDADGPVSTGRAAPPPGARGRFPERAPARSSAPPRDEASDGTVSSLARKAIPIAPDPHRKGGISFEDDDLADYMHPDDVAPKDPPGGES